MAIKIHQSNSAGLKALSSFRGKSHHPAVHTAQVVYAKESCKIRGLRINTNKGKGLLSKWTGQFTEWC